ncbi:Cna B-type domain-containing protein [Gemmiger formicilis]|uniref:Cna B-type domain-containing protein n=1 Tax=Gemmiger formicilis TaxID=745368 RepID=UPI0022E6F814|nr:Cna B-type domain-containing protein [Gemmiger formicilis]
MAALMFFQCTAPVAFAADDTILAESSIVASSAESESVPVDSDAGYIPEQSPENTSVDSSSNDAASSEPLTGDSSASSDLPEDASSNGSVESQPESDTDQISTSDETIDSELAESSSENTDESAKSLYQDGKILIYTCDQLAEIGSGQTLTDASGLAVTDENGAEITYALDAQYAIAEDIELTGDMLQWQLPEGFTGSITPLAESSDDLTLYDAQSDTIYLYNPYQMAVLHGENPDTEPVMDGDAQAETFGSGQLIYPNGESEPYLTYSLNHRYILSRQFCSDTSVKPYSVVTDGKADGRDFAGQVVKTIGDKTYILIGNEQQLRKIGSGDTVYGAVYQAIHHNAQWTIDHDSSGNLIMLYGGDADLTKGQNGTDDYTLGKDGVHEADKKFSDKANNLLYVYTVGRCGVNQKTGEIDPNLDIDKAANQTYAANANYIIFRDIDLSTKEWTPLTFQGTMIGAKSANGEKIWNDDSSAINTSTKPTISNVSVMQTGKLNVGEQMGVGFFSTISSEVSENDIGLSKGLVQVSNLKFQNISVQTTTSETYYPETLVSTLTSTLGKLLGGLVSGLTFILTFGQVKVDLGKTLGDVLDARKKDPTALATGAIAGRVEGQVEFSGIEVIDATVRNVNNNTGGFVGYTVGVTQYDGLSKALGKIVELLTNILNVIPGLGLGDLITILLGNAIPLEKLIPTGYINAKFVNCGINNLSLTTASDKEYAGGFVGQQVGSIFENCSITGSSYTVNGANYVGGFAGIARDGVIEGTLSGALDIQTKLPKMNTESLLLNCTLENATISVKGENYVGGFAGAFANTSAVNCTLTTTEPLTVHATGSNVGGFAGIATLGWAANLGKSDTKDNLLGGLVDLVVKLLSSDKNSATSLLSLAGVNPSYILGCTINAPLTVIGTNYAGGITGRGDGAYIAPSSADYLSKVSYWRNGVYYPATVEQRNTTVSGLQSVSGHDYTGGIAGSLGTASVGGLLNNTAGIASYLGFTVDGVTVTGSDNGLTVDGWERVGGGLGDAIGGTINNVSVNNLKSIEGKNYAGGFIGLSGPGELVGTDGGLTVNLLGLNYLLTLNKLLSIGQYVQVTIKDANVNGIDKDGFTVEATEKREANSVLDYTAAGFIARSNSTKVENAHVTNLKSVTAANDGGYAAGFVAISKTGGLAEVGEDKTQVKSLIKTNGLVTAISYLIPSYKNCTVSYVTNGSVTGDVAGGFTADFQSGTVNNQARGENDYYAVYNLGSVNGQSYAGGFAGRVYSGALADASKGISILGDLTGVNIKLSDLLSVINAYVPYIQYAGVKSDGGFDGGFTVTATKLTEDTTVGSAGGFVGYASGAQISYSDVTKLKHTIVKAPDNLEDISAPTYFNNESTYAVTGGRYAGGYVGDMDIGSAASVGGGLKVLGNAVSVIGILNALSVVVTTIEHSDVTGGTGGYAVLATGDLNKGNGKVGMAGGYAGGMYGGHIQDSQAVNFSYIIGEIAAGGYVGEMQPGDVAKLLKNASILDGLVNVNEVLASVLQSFVPSIRNSSTNCVPCGGAVRANAASDTTVQRGMAGGYVGHNMGGTIHGFDTSLWFAEDGTSKAYNGPMSLCKAERIRSVYGHEYAGGYTGLMEPADTAKVGGLKVLGSLITVDNILGALGVIYPVQTNTAVYGPLAGLDMDTWNSWVEYVGVHGGYGYELAQTGKVDSQAELDAKLADYIYGYNVVAGRSEFDNMLYGGDAGGDAGGYVGCMNSGTLTNCMAYDAKQVSAMHSAGGFAGQMKTGGAVELGTVNILGLNLNVGQLVNIAQLFVPAIRNSSVQGYQSGLTVQATGLPENHCGYSGGYVGSAYGAQIQLDGANKLPTADQWKSTSKYAAPVASCNATNLRRVTGRIAVGGYVGLASAGSVAGVNTNASNGLLQGILDHLISAPGNLVKVLQATATTIHAATVSAADSKWGFVVDGSYKEGDAVKYAAYAGGFAGSLEASAVGEEKSTTKKIQVQNLRSVDGGLYAGGFFGLADVAGVAQVSGKDPKETKSTLLKGLIKLGNISVLDAFRTYVFDSSVTGVQDGLKVQAHTVQNQPEGNFTETRYAGCAGGFGGGMMDGSVKNSAVSNLANVEGLNYTGGFVGHLGKSGVADIDDVSVLNKLLSGPVGALDLFGSHVENCSVSGFGLGTVIKAQGGQQPIAGGFAGYADLAKISSCSTDLLKKVSSGQIAGGFIGKTDMNYIVNTELQSQLLNFVFAIVNKLLSILYIGDLQKVGVIDINLGWPLTVKVLADGKTLEVSLLGLDISVALNQDLGGGQGDLAIITIGDSVIELPCTQNGIDKDKISNVKINLIKGNRTDIDSCTVSGISSGYDVYAGGADDTADGSDSSGYSGGFIGLNHEGQVKNSTMTLCDVVRGTENLVGPFTGVNDLKSVYSFNTIKSIEGNNNHYSIYRAFNEALKEVVKADKTPFGTAEQDVTTGTNYNRYQVLHLDKITAYTDLKNAQMAGNGVTADLSAYASPAKAVLMLDTANSPNPDNTTSEPADTADPCKKYVDLTISKIWKDLSNFDGSRPKELTVKVYQQTYDIQGTPINKVLYKTVTLTEADREAGHAATWRKVLKNAPVAKYKVDANDNVTDEIEYYYVYTFEEEDVPGYTASQSYNGKTYHVTFTNTHQPKLPFTGGSGDLLFVAIGAVLILFALTTGKTRRKAKRQGGYKTM